MTDVEIDLEIQLREFDRCRILYEKLLEFSPENCSSWIKYAELEAILGDVDRVRAIFELAINQPRLDMPEVLWKAYIDFEVRDEPTRGTGLRVRASFRARPSYIRYWRGVGVNWGGGGI